MYLVVQPKPELGKIAYAPTSLLATELAILIAALAEGTSLIYHDLRCHDTFMLQEACQAIGAIIHRYPDHLEITGVAGHIQFQRKNLHSRRAVFVCHIFAALACFSQTPVVLNGDISLQQCVMTPLFEAMKQLGAAMEPIEVSRDIPLIHWGGGLNNDVCDLPGQMSQACLIAMIMMATLAPMPILLRIHGKLVAQSALMQTITMLIHAGITVEIDEEISLIRVYPGVARANNYQLCGDYVGVMPLLSLFALHPGSYDIHQLKSDGLPDEASILGLFSAIGLSFQQDTLTHGLLVNNPQQRLVGHYHIDISEHADIAPLLVVLTAFIRGRVRFVGVDRLSANASMRLEDLLVMLDKLGVIFSLTRQDSCINAVDIMGAASYQGGLVFDNITDPLIFMGLVIASTRCRQANYFTYDDGLEGNFPDFIGEMQRLGVRCGWVADALHMQPYWLTAS